MVSNNPGFEKSGVKVHVQCKREANPREMAIGSSFREIQETEGSRNQDCTIHCVCYKEK